MHVTVVVTPSCDAHVTPPFQRNGNDGALHDDRSRSRIASSLLLSVRAFRNSSATSEIRTANRIFPRLSIR